MKFSAFARVIAFSGLAAALRCRCRPAAFFTRQPAHRNRARTPALALPSPLPSANVAPDTVVLTIGDANITRAQFELLLAALGAKRTPAPPRPPRSGRWPNSTPSSKPWSKRRASASWTRSPEVKQMMSIQSDSVLANTLAKTDLRRYPFHRTRSALLLRRAQGRVRRGQGQATF